jgi:hypothetical protein
VTGFRARIQKLNIMAALPAIGVSKNNSCARSGNRVLCAIFGIFGIFDRCNLLTRLCKECTYCKRATYGLHHLRFTYLKNNS